MAFRETRFSEQGQLEETRNSLSERSKSKQHSCHTSPSSYASSHAISPFSFNSSSSSSAPPHSFSPDWQVDTIKIETITTITILILLILPLLPLPLPILPPILLLRHLLLNLPPVAPLVFPKLAGWTSPQSARPDSPNKANWRRWVPATHPHTAPGSDAILAEVYKHGGPQLMDHLTALFQAMWRQGEIPQDFKDATIVHLYIRNGNRQICDNHRGISLLNIAGKIFARILLNRLNNHLEQGLLPESQCCFRRHRGTTGMIFAARQLQ
ncbi:hypothetical protein SprV_1002913900 [Sparganum proliferum]